ncbi:uncharacterized protein NPIL_353851 [Nephila pilipes]|uniref:Uncharacterized protein n=1 Tax=Nephila pilipes TaxID=299642 RepID=A0A8X6P0M9_NEPPI|nr:uncharacterized protein NPIL_353851 [Nephila pilipes]
MNQLLSAILLMDVPLIADSVKAVIAAGILISGAGISGIGGAYSESLLLLILNLFYLAMIIMMEFGLGVTLLIVRKTVENYIEKLECNTNCAATLDSLVLDYALPSAGLMLTIIVVEATMMYSAIKLCFSLRDTTKIIESVEGDVVQTVQMRNVEAPCQPYAPSPHPVFSPNLNCSSNRMHPAFSMESPLTRFPNNAPKPPQYNDLPPDQQLPPAYAEVVPTVLVNRPQRMEETGRQMTCNSV